MSDKVIEIKCEVCGDRHGPLYAYTEEQLFAKLGEIAFQKNLLDHAAELSERERLLMSLLVDLHLRKAKEEIDNAK